MKKLVSLVLAMFFLGASVSCSGSDAVVQAPPKAPVKRMELVLWSYYETDAQKQSLDRIVNGFNESQDRFTSRWEYVPMADFKKKLSIGMMQNGLPDLALIDSPDMAYFIQLGLFQAVSDPASDWKDLEQYYDSALDSVVQDDVLYGLPFIHNSAALIYNKKLLDAAGIAPPATWDELKSAAAALTNDEVWGFSISALRYEQATFQFLPWLFSTGATLEECDSPTALRAYHFFDELVRSGSMPRDCVNWSQVDLGRMFAEGKIAMMENGPWLLPDLRNVPGLEWGIVELPRDASYAAVRGGENLGIVQGKNVEGAWAFLEYCAQPQVMEAYCPLVGGLPPRRDLAEKSQWKDNPDFSIFVKQLSYSVSRGQYENWPTISEAVSTNFCNMLLGNQTPEQAAAAVKAVHDGENKSDGK